MYKAIDKNNKEISIRTAIDGEKYFCPICNGELIIKAAKSEVITPHFAHKNLIDCDTFSHDMSEWHKEWQNKFPLENREVALPIEKPCHRADVMIGDYVIEFQHSFLTAEEFDERNRFYTSIGKRVIWIFDVSEKYKSGSFTLVKSNDEWIENSYGTIEKKENINEFRTGTTFRMISDYEENQDYCVIDYVYGSNVDPAEKQIHEWKWKRPLNTLIHYNPAVNKDVVVFLEFSPGNLKNIIWCDDEIDKDIAGYIAKEFHNNEMNVASSKELYLEYRDVITKNKSNFRAFTAVEYSVNDFLSEITNKFI